MFLKFCNAELSHFVTTDVSFALEKSPPAGSWREQALLPCPVVAGSGSGHIFLEKQKGAPAFAMGQLCWGHNGQDPDPAAALLLGCLFFGKQKHGMPVCDLSSNHVLTSFIGSRLLLTSHGHLMQGQPTVGNFSVIKDQRVERTFPDVFLPLLGLSALFLLRSCSHSLIASSGGRFTTSQNQPWAQGDVDLGLNFSLSLN